MMNQFATNNQNSSWINVDDSNTHRFDLNSEYRVILKQEDEFQEDEYTAIYMNACTKYELYFNDAIEGHFFGCININDLSHYQYRVKGHRDQRPQSKADKYPIYKLQRSTHNKSAWKEWGGKYFNVKHDYRAVIDEEDSKSDLKLSKLTVSGFVRSEQSLENKGFNIIVGVIGQYYHNCGSTSYINMEQVVKRELYFTPSIDHHYYGCVSSDKPNKWHYRFQGNCVKKVNDTPKFKCHKIMHRVPINEDEKYHTVNVDETTQFNIDYQYRIRLIRNGGYIVVERVTKDALYFGVSISKFWAGCVKIDNLHSWHYVDKSTNHLSRIGKGNYTVYSVECRK
mmetsp:Transcript_16376/g.14679  ORF Transcript_16376/g.14679 Transcript_16376/m.14679 type:complete len:339 (-) Transcript_16376:474-1490(-)